MKVKDLQRLFETIAPLSLQESYDNSGLLVGNSNDEISKAIITIDVTEAVVDEAIAENADCIIAHHPLIFKGIKKLTGSNEIERCLIKAIKHSIAIYCAHTNMDNVFVGINKMIADKIGLISRQILAPSKDTLVKLVSFVPTSHIQQVRTALCNAGAGQIGNYSDCTFSTEGKGTFTANEGSSPFVGEQAKLHTEVEERLETVVPKYALAQVLQALQSAHPYEEVAYDVFALENVHPQIGAGLIGELENPEDVSEFLQRIKTTFKADGVRYTESKNNKIKRVAICGGAGSFLISAALRAKADIFITGDVKYHDFFIPENKMVIADIGHYESEQYTKELFYEIVTKKFPKFALHLSKVNTNPIKYL